MGTASRTCMQFIVSASLHRQESDTPCLSPHYDYLEQHHLGSYLKYNTFLTF